MSAGRRLLEIERLVGLGLTRAQKADIANYRLGDVLVFHNDLYQFRVKADDACTVTGTDEGKVELHHPDGRLRRIDPSRPVRYRYEAYETRPIRLQAGDRIRWTRNNAKRGLANGQWRRGGDPRHRLAGEARRRLNRPELDPGARAKLERQVGIHDASRRQDRSRDIGEGGGMKL